MKLFLSQPVSVSENVLIILGKINGTAEGCYIEFSEATSAGSARIENAV